jgi:class 3 adenylate cyclase
MEIAMSIRIYLGLSYLVLILLLSAGMWGLADYLAHRLTTQSLTNAQRGAQGIVDKSYQISEKVLTVMGERLVELRVEGVAKGLAYRLKDRDTSNYAKLREDEGLRKLATQPIQTPDGVGGYLMVYDKKGEVLFHQKPTVEGKNSLNWQKEYPETQELIRRSLSEERVKGYYTFRDKEGKERRRYAIWLHVNGTPFVVSAQVNIDDFFLPAQKRLKEACEKIMSEARARIKESSKNIDRQVKLVILMGWVLLSVVGGLCGVFFAAALARPILRLRDGVRQVGTGDFAVTVPEKGLKEVVHLAQSFNRLGEQLTDYIAKRDFIRDTFGRYVTQEVVKRILEANGLTLGGETREVSILMSDLRGFTALTADMQPEQVIVFLNRYLGKMIEILMDYRAVIDEIIGDGILAFFGAPEAQEDHPVRAVACALKMQQAMEEINVMNAADGMPLLRMGVGVHTGTVVVGNIGSEKRTKYSVVGSPVNFTGRVEAVTVGGQVLISASTYDRVRDLVEVHGTIEVEMKGIPQPATLFDVRALEGPYQIRLPERPEKLVRLPERLPIELYRLQEKIVTGLAGAAWITQLGDTQAVVVYEGELAEWEDVRLHLLDEHQVKLPGKVYGKVTSVKHLEPPLHEANISFTSVSLEVYRLIQKITGTP